MKWRCMGKAVCASLYSKPVKLATTVSWPPVTVGHTFTESANSYNILQGHYSVHNLTTCVLWNLATASQLGQWFMQRHNSPVLTGLKSCTVFVSYCTGAEILIYIITCCQCNLSSFSTSMENRLEFSSGNWPVAVLSSPYALARLCTFPTQPPVSAIWTVHLHRL
jgi:hypothetical protein